MHEVLEGRTDLVQPHTSYASSATGLAMGLESRVGPPLLTLHREKSLLLGSPGPTLLCEGAQPCPALLHAPILGNEK